MLTHTSSADARRGERKEGLCRPITPTPLWLREPARDHRVRPAAADTATSGAALGRSSRRFQSRASRRPTRVNGVTFTVAPFIYSFAPLVFATFYCCNQSGPAAGPLCTRSSQASAE